MLIERGANVNAPRLPRRYSDGRKSNAPSVGTAGKSDYDETWARLTDRLDTFALCCGKRSRSYRPNPISMWGNTRQARQERHDARSASRDPRPH